MSVPNAVCNLRFSYDLLSGHADFCICKSQAAWAEPKWERPKFLRVFQALCNICSKCSKLCNKSVVEEAVHVVHFSSRGCVDVCNRRVSVERVSSVLFSRNDQKRSQMIGV